MISPVDEEIFDVVDQHDRVIEQRTRSEVHRRHLLHRSVHVLVYNARGEIFLQKRSMHKDCNPGVWDASVSGHVDAGETYDECALREAREELGLELASVPRRLFKLEASEQTSYEFSCVYRLEAEGPFDVDGAEIERADWFAVDDVDRWMRQRPQDFAGPMRLIWRRIREGDAA